MEARQQMPGAERQVILVSGPRALHKGHALRSLAVRGTDDFSLRGACPGCQPLHHHVGDHVRILAETVGFKLLGIVGFPPACPNNGTDLEIHGLGGHVQLNGVVGTGLFHFLGFPALHQGRVQDIAHGERHVMRKVGCFPFAHSVIERILNFHGARFSAFAAARAFLVHVPGVQPDRHVEIPFGSGDRLHFRHGKETNPRIVFDPPEVDLQPAKGRTQFGEVVVELRHSSSKVGISLHHVGVISRFRCFDCGRHTAHAATDDQDALGVCACHAYPPRMM